jgi:hypothetical protein
VPNGRHIWQPTPDEYAIGFPPDFRNGNGGVAIGYNYNPAGEILLGSCGGFMWTTGEDLRHAADAALVARLSQSGSLDVNGLQGNGTWRIRRGDEPPLYSYFIDYADEYDDPAERGHIGDIAIERLCSPAQRAGLLPFGGAPPIGAPPGAGAPPQAGNPPGTPSTPPNTPPNTPPSGCQPGQVRQAGTDQCGNCPRPGIQVNGTCCSVTQLAANAACSNSSCASGQISIGPSNFCCNSSQVYSGVGGVQACCNGPLVNGTCPTPVIPPITTCGKGYVMVGGACCLANKVTSTGICCPAGQAPSGPNNSQCVNIIIIPIKLPPGPQCCASGIPTASGACCAPANVTTSGVCCSGPVDPQNRSNCPAQIQTITTCAAGYTKMSDGSCCNNRFLGADGKSCNVTQRSCAPGEFRDFFGACLPIPSTLCPPGQFRGGRGTCVPIPTTTCPPGQERNHEGICIAVRGACPPGEIRNREGACVPERPVACPPGLVRNAEGVPERPTACPPGQIRDRNGICVPAGPPPRLIVPGGPPGPVPPPPHFPGGPPGPIPPRIFIPR